MWSNDINHFRLQLFYHFQYARCTCTYAWYIDSFGYLRITLFKIENVPLIFWLTSKQFIFSAVFGFFYSVTMIY